MSPDRRQLQTALSVCSMCKQVLLSTDEDYHYKMHEMIQNFPSLGDAGTQKQAGNRK